MAPTDAEITQFHDTPPDGDPFLPGRAAKPYPILVEEHDAAWAGQFQQVAGRIRAALPDGIVELHHVGSTSVPGLPAKPIIDIDLVVADPANEPAYVEALEGAGFVHVIREPWWHEHRLLKGSDPATHLHVFGPDCPEVIRHLMFREWLLEQPGDFATYAEAKRSAAAAVNARAGGGTGMDYNFVKEPVVRAIYGRMFRAHGLLP